MSCTQTSQYIASSFVYGLCGISTIWPIFQYLRSRQKIDPDKCFYLTALIFFVTITISFTSFAILNAVRIPFGCGSIANIFALVGYIGFAFQLALLFWLLFYRLQRIFNNSVYAISSRIKMAFYVSYILWILTAIVVVGIVSSNLKQTALLPIAIGFAFTFILLYIIALVSLLIYKLISVSKRVAFDNDQKPMAAIVTKIFLLSFMSIISIVLLAVSSVIDSLLKSKGIDNQALFMAVFMSLVLLANFYSLFLGFVHFNAYYMRLCGGCHRVCTDCCLQIMSDSNAPPIESKAIHSIGSRSVTPVTKTTTHQNNNDIESS